MIKKEKGEIKRKCKRKKEEKRKTIRTMNMIWNFQDGKAYFLFDII